MSNPLTPRQTSSSKWDPNYGRPLAGSLTEMRGKKAAVHISREMLQLCEIIDSQGQPNEYNPELKVILFGELFNIYTYISSKLVGILLRARKHELVYFEGEMLFQRRDDDVPIFMLRTLPQIHEMQRSLDEQVEQDNQNSNGRPLPTTILMDRMQQHKP